MNIQLWQRISRESDIVRPGGKGRANGFRFTIVRNRLNHLLAQKTAFASIILSRRDR